MHQAPAYGEEDQKIGEAAGIPVIISLDEGGKFLPAVTDVAGHALERREQAAHPAAEGRGAPAPPGELRALVPALLALPQPAHLQGGLELVRPRPEFRDRMGELNQDITWVPENVKDGQFGKWVAGARDWSISRNRYWGSPIPVWKSDDPEYPRVDVYGSLDELERDFGTLPRNPDGEPDLHRPYIDELTRPNPDDPTGRSTMRRIPDVLDVWFDSGSMPFAQVHYPFENQEWFDTHHPADFIVEYIGQTRGWFYVMHVLSTALFDRPAFKNVVSHGIVLGSDGQKMSKSLRNYPDVNEVFDRDGSDAMRWFLMSSPVLRGGNLVVTEEGIREGVRQVMLPLWSTWYFFSLYANTAPRDGRLRGDRGAPTRPTCSTATCSRSSATSSTRGDRRPRGPRHDARRAASCATSPTCSPTGTCVARATGSGRASATTAAAREAFDTLYTVLETFTRLAAPLLPLMTEQIWRGPHRRAQRAPGRLAGRRRVPRRRRARRRDGRGARDQRLRARAAQAGGPPRAAAAGEPHGRDDGCRDASRRSRRILRDELNVKSVDLVDARRVERRGYGITKRLSVNARAAGPRLGKTVQQAIQAARAGDWTRRRRRGRRRRHRARAAASTTSCSRPAAPATGRAPSRCSPTAAS